jgi:hypothetical protein
LTSGTYRLSVWARDAAGTGTHTNTLGSYDAWVASTYELNSACSSVTTSATPPSPSARGVDVSVNASATPCLSPLFQFWLQAPGATSYTIEQPYSSNAVFNWPTTGLASGTYHLSVWARDAAGVGTHTNSLGSYDAFLVTIFTLT